MTVLEVEVPLREWWKRGKADVIKPFPWLHPAVVMYLESLIQPDWRVLEHGAGGSTLWFAERVSEVLTVEHDIKWVDAVSNAIYTKNITITGGFVPDFHCFDNAPYDLLLVDGHRDWRTQWIEAAPNLVRPGGIVVFDNCNRPEYRQARKFIQGYASHYIYFMVNAPGHSNAVTEMYRMPGGDRNERWL